MSTSWYEDKTTAEIGSPADWFAILEMVKHENPFWQDEAHGVAKALYKFAVAAKPGSPVSISAALVALSLPLFHEEAGLSEYEKTKLATKLEVELLLMDAAERSETLAPILAELINTSKALSYVPNNSPSLQSVFARLNNLLVEENTEFVVLHPSIGNPVRWRQLLRNRRAGMAGPGPASTARLLNQLDEIAANSGVANWVIPVADSQIPWDTDPEAIKTRNIAVSNRLRDYLNAARNGLRTFSVPKEPHQGPALTQRGERFTIG